MLIFYLIEELREINTIGWEYLYEFNLILETFPLIYKALELIVQVEYGVRL